MAWIATQNFREVDRLLSHDNPAATLRFKPLGADARMTMRFQAAEMNRWLFKTWEEAQIAYGVFFFLVMLFGSRESKFVLIGVLLLLLVTLLQHFLLMPELVALGRLIDFVPPNTPSHDRDQFWVVHVAYSAVEGVKWVFILMLTAQMVFSRQRSGRSRDSRQQVDRVDKAYYRGVNR